MFNAVLKCPGFPGAVIEISGTEELRAMFTDGYYKSVLLDGVCLFFECCGAGFTLAKARILDNKPYNVSVGDMRYFGNVVLCASDKYGVPRQADEAELKAMLAWL